VLSIIIGAAACFAVGFLAGAGVLSIIIGAAACFAVGFLAGAWWGYEYAARTGLLGGITLCPKWLRGRMLRPPLSKRPTDRGVKVIVGEPPKQKEVRKW